MKLEHLGTPGERRAARELIMTTFGIWMLSGNQYEAVELLFKEIGRDVPPNVVRLSPAKKEDQWLAIER